MTSTPPAASSFAKPRFRRPRRSVLIGVGAVLLAALAIWFFFLRGDGAAEPYRTEAVRRGEITRSVSASGTLEALVTVEVGSQISGQVTQVMVDYNDRVRRGQVMAVLDPQNQRSAVEQSQAQIASAQAGVAQAQAQVALAQAEYDRQKYLFDRQIIAQAALDTAQASLRTARANVASAQAQVRQAQASLRSDQATLGRTTITAPIDGIVIDRQIEPGQTVASGLNVAVLFTLAQDLGRVQALVNVDEADIGQVRVGQPVRFTVDAFSDDSFTGQVTQIRVLPTTESNVVAYTVVVEADNPGERLLPGMTANAEIVLEEKRGVLRVPNSALRFTPADVETQEQAGAGGGASPFGPGAGGQQRRAGGSPGRGNMAAAVIEELGLDAAQKARVQPILDRAQQEARAARRSGGAQQGGGQRRRGANPAAAAAFNKAFDEIKPLLRPDQQVKLEALRGRFAGGGGRGTVWVLRDGRPVQVSVRTGATDGSYTEVLGGELKEGDQVITGGGPRRTDARAQQQAQRMAGGGFGGGGGPR
ncbi:MAG TPA: efflux RND transporter periplasmic adaptor subunit [Brevundimonas sp.]|jgi:HlyD family secretion protein|uniref:efflux RND transporter periplasmic adaptor subunit n=1 Tax=Brevundimonas sp. TaxID=1871086 RepID=UPI002DE30A1E|nr:efflux RND transporter periplasmic adaptor subunit [Brevundimonas sp.]